MSALNKLPCVLIITPCTKERAVMANRLMGMIRRQHLHYSGQILTAWHWGEGVIGNKRNELINANKCDIVLHMDSDDIYADDWVSKSVNGLIETKADITGLDNAYFYNTRTGKVKEFITPPNAQTYILGATLCYWRKIWERKPFENIQRGEDSKFQANNGIVLPHKYKEGFIATVHGGNTECHKAFPMLKDTTVKPVLLSEL